MSRPACSWSARTDATASVSCSRWSTSAIASENAARLRFSVYQVGRGHDPVTVVGRSRSFVAVSIASSFRGFVSPGSSAREDVETDGEDEDHAHRDLLVERILAEQRVAVPDQGDEEDADDRPP